MAEPDDKSTREERLTAREAGVEAGEELLSVREAGVEADEERLRVREEAARQIRLEFDELVNSLREANEHLVTASLRAEVLAEQMTRLYEEATSAIKARDDFFALISHELRTPLTSISGWADLLQMEPDPATIVLAARSIAMSASLQAKLVDDLLDVSRILTGKFDIVMAPIDLRDVVDDAVSAANPTAFAKGLGIRVKAESVNIMGDEARLRQAIGNLLSNALKFTPPGGLVEVCLAVDPSGAFVTVEDSGEGIPPEFLEAVFDRLSQVIPRRFGGLGLGLAIVKRIVNLHGGTVSATSDGVGKGAVFQIRLPVALSIKVGSDPN